MTALGVLGRPETAAALQTHGDPEGLYVHQVAHVLFLAAMLYLAWEIRRQRLDRRRGFRWLIWASLGLAAWNLDAFVGHWMESRLASAAFSGRVADFSQRVLVDDAVSAWYYLTKFDHLLLVPALLLFYGALQALAREREGPP